MEDGLKTGWSNIHFEFKQMGFIAEALVNYMTLLGWSHQTQEIFTAKKLPRCLVLSASIRLEQSLIGQSWIG